jgi:hypothetical protein
MSPDEVDRLECKGDHDPGNPQHRLQLVKEIVAMANALGGVIRIGETADGARPGIEAAAAIALDPARVCDLVDSFIAGEHIELTQSTSSANTAGFSVIEIEVPRHPRPPLVFTKSGNFQSSSGRQEFEFRRGDIYIRKGTKAEPVARADVLRWVDEAVEAERERWRSRVAFIAKLPADAELSFVAGSSGPQGEPAAVLARAVPIWKRDQSKLLSAQELATLLVARDSLTPDGDGQELIFQSALRRRATLWHWLVDFSPTAERIRQSLLLAVEGSDRDKSDAGGAIIDVAALMLDRDAYKQVVAALGSSSYAHFKEAAAEGRDRGAVLTRLRDLRERAISGEVIADLSDSELRSRTRDLAAELMRSGRHTSQSRQLNRFGLESIARSPLGRRIAEN